MVARLGAGAVVGVGHLLGATGAQVSAVGRHGRGSLAGVLAEDETLFVLLFQVGDVLHHTLTVGDGELVGAI